MYWNDSQPKNLNIKKSFSVQFSSVLYYLLKFNLDTHGGGKLDLSYWVFSRLQPVLLHGHQPFFCTGHGTSSFSISAVLSPAKTQLDHGTLKAGAPGSWASGVWATKVLLFSWGIHKGSKDRKTADSFSPDLKNFLRYFMKLVSFPSKSKSFY